MRFPFPCSPPLGAEDLRINKMERITRHGVTAPLTYLESVDRFMKIERITNSRYYEVQDLVDDGTLTHDQQIAYSQGEFELPEHIT